MDLIFFIVIIFKLGWHSDINGTDRGKTVRHEAFVLLRAATQRRAVSWVLPAAIIVISRLTMYKPCWQNLICPRVCLRAMDSQLTTRSRRLYLASTSGNTDNWVAASCGPRGLAFGSLYYFSFALSLEQEGELYWHCNRVHYLFIQRSEDVPLHLGIGHNDVLLYALSTSRARHAFLFHRSFDTWDCIYDCIFEYESLIHEKSFHF